MNDSPLVSVLFLGAALYVLHLWRQDRARQEREGPDPRALPGATSVSGRWVAIAALGGLGLALAATALEAGLGITGEQRTIQASFLAAMLGAAVIEELVFRGYFVIEGKGRPALVAGIVGASLVFALLHPYLWSFDKGDDDVRRFAWTITTANIVYTATIFANSLWFYACRFLPANPHRSLLPCFAAHAAYNVAVFAVKLSVGKVALG